MNSKMRFFNLLLTLALFSPFAALSQPGFSDSRDAARDTADSDASVESRNGMRNEIIEWQNLTEDQQEMLSPFRDTWSLIPGFQQQRLLRSLQRWERLPSEHRDRTRRRGQEWSRFSREDRERIRKNFEEFEKLPREEREAIRESYKNFMELSVQRRRELFEEFQRQNPSIGRRPSWEMPGSRETEEGDDSVERVE